MQVIEYNNYVQLGRAAEKTLRDLKDNLDVATKEDLRLTVLRAETLRKAREVTGRKFAVVSDDDVKKGVAGFVTVANAKPHIVESFLDSPDAMKIVSHENGHVDDLVGGVKDIAIKDNISAQEYEVLNNFTQEHGFDLDEIDLLEGFNEFDGITRRGKIDGCLYNEKFVPAALLLEKLCADMTGRSLRGAYKSHNMDLFYELLKSVCAVIALRERFGFKDGLNLAD